MNIDLGVNGAGDAAIDAVTVNGTVGADDAASGTPAPCRPGRRAHVSITNAEPANDTLTINTSGGDDIVGASGLARTPST